MGTVLVVPLTLLPTGTVLPAGAVVSVHAPGYLALGDSITFGFREGSTVPPPAYADAQSFVGYPEDIGAALGWRVVNAACPGETAASFIDVRAQSDGCETFASSGPGYRASFPLHVTYRGPQLQYAVGYLRAHPKTKPVSLVIGVNDLFACVATTADHCASEHGKVLGKVADDVAHILGTIRKGGHYTGQIVVVNYYSLSSAESVGSATLFDNTGIAQLNAAVDHAAVPFAVTFASGEGLRVCRPAVRRRFVRARIAHSAQGWRLWHPSQCRRPGGSGSCRGAVPIRDSLLQIWHSAHAGQPPPGSGSVINAASFLAVVGAASSQMAYSAAKAGVL